MRQISLLLLLLCACTHSTDSADDSADDSDLCKPQILTQHEREERKVFLDFYYGMTPHQYDSTVSLLVDKGILYQSDSTVKFSISVRIPDEDAAQGAFAIKGEDCIFRLSPLFDGCSLSSLKLVYVPTEIILASLRSYVAGESCKDAHIPDELKVLGVEKLFKSKYGKPTESASREGFWGSYDHTIWRHKGTEIEIGKKYEIMCGGDRKQQVLSWLQIEYKSILALNNFKAEEDSIKVRQERETLHKEKLSKESI